MHKNFVVVEGDEFYRDTSSVDGNIFLLRRGLYYALSTRGASKAIHYADAPKRSLIPITTEVAIFQLKYWPGFDYDVIDTRPASMFATSKFVTPNGYKFETRWISPAWARM